MIGEWLEVTPMIGEMLEVTPMIGERLEVTPVIGERLEVRPMIGERLEVTPMIGERLEVTPMIGIYPQCLPFYVSTILRLTRSNESSQLFFIKSTADVLYAVSTLYIWRSTIWTCVRLDQLMMEAGMQ